MRNVVDTNLLQTEKFRSYLAKSKRNFAVLTDYSAMESYKGNTLLSLSKSMEILCEFPKQVIVLKSTPEVCALSGRSYGLQARLIDNVQTKGFALFARQLREALDGNLQMQQRLLSRGKEATRHFERVEEDTDNIKQFIRDVTKLYSRNDLAAFRAGDSFDPDFVKQTVKYLCHTSRVMFDAHPNVTKLPSTKELPYTFIFRNALCGYLMSLEWAANGGADDASSVKLRNDVVDMSFVAYATFFDGVLSEDGKVKRIHKRACAWLSTVFGCRLSQRA